MMNAKFGRERCRESGTGPPQGGAPLRQPSSLMALMNDQVDQQHRE
jgi:hypothetical protein